MRVLVAGASGVIGQPLVKLLLTAGHSVIGTSRSPIRAERLRSLRVTPLVIDVYDAQALGNAVAAARPEIVVHLLTDLPDRIDPDGMAEMSARNARVRIEGTRNLIAAVVRSGARRLVAQSIAWAYVPGREPHVEEDPLDMEAEGNRGVTVHGVAELERLVGSVPRLEALILRFGQLYGPGTWNAGPTGSVPLHVEAAARAAALAVVRGGPGTYNVVEDGSAASNVKARGQLGWDPAIRCRVP
ncbi:MAG: NAD-dependent epimerase/dehydratase family protein [Candidatus Rokuibacteriota bacterium]